MSAVGRNDSCPCGSGKKYKRCCLGKDAPAPGAWTAGERDGALARLMRFSRRAEFDGDRAAAELTFWGKRLERLTRAEAREAMDFEQSRVGFHEWLVFDCPLHGGGTIVERFLAREGDGLRSGERRYLARMRLSHLRPYEIQAVRLDEGLDLLDLWANKRVPVRERLATRQLVQWDVLAARVILGPHGAPVLDGSPYLYPAREKELILRVLRRLSRSLRGKLPLRDETAFFKNIGMAFHDLWLELVARRPMPTSVTAEGDEVMLCRAVFDVRDRAALEAALANRPELERQDDGSYAWLAESADEGGFRRGFGTFVLEERRVVLETISRQRAERGRALLEAAAGPAVAYRATSHESVQRALERRRARPAARDRRPARPEEEVPPEAAAEIVQAFYERHYRGWLDEPLPALRGRTPRQAVGLKSARPKVIALLKDMENLSARERMEGHSAYDFGWMWGELGLERPG
ncbi:MAG TPA: SEC-C metal-binding domain-containing protein [Methylomirabilota bacterium]|nr:SEC-C metal-binding domain-containing protein [Methylomirabilota bacterium]